MTVDVDELRSLLEAAEAKAGLWKEKAEQLAVQLLNKDVDKEEEATLRVRAIQSLRNAREDQLFAVIQKMRKVIKSSVPGCSATVPGIADKFRALLAETSAFEEKSDD